MKGLFAGHNQENWFTLKEVAILIDKSEGFIKSKIAKGELKKYDKYGNILNNPIQTKGFFKESEVKKVFAVDIDLRILQKPRLCNNRPYLKENIRPKEIVKINSFNLLPELERIKGEQFDVCISSLDCKPSELTVPFNFNENLKTNQNYLELTYNWMDKICDLLTENGSFLIHHVPVWLPYYAVHLTSKMVFKYWIAVHSFGLLKEKAFNPVSTGVLFMLKTNENFLINTLRESHAKCKYCGEMLKDYGGKKHLMHQAGAALSDVWKTILVDYSGINSLENNYRMPPLLINRLINLACTNNSRLLLAPFVGDV